MEKFGVDTEEEPKTGAAGSSVRPVCPDCGATLEQASNVPKCPKCGTKPFEKDAD